MYDKDNTSTDILQVAKKILQIEKIPTFEIHGCSPVQATEQGARHCEGLYMAKPPPGAQIQKISKEEYIDLRTGEIKQFKLNDTKQRKNLAETFRNLTGLIRANFDQANEDRQLFITLTYAENMTNHRKLYDDFESWYRRLRRFLGDQHLEYIAVAEPQERGAWHMHVMLKSDKHLFVDNRDMEKLWRHGFTDTQRLKSDDVGRYYVAYFTDLFGEFGATAKKKGGRLPLYPVGMKFYRCSRGIVRPEDEEMSFADIVERWGTPSYSDAFQVRDTLSGEVVQRIQRMSFKKSESDGNDEK